jgi:hypothetical protein
LECDDPSNEETCSEQRRDVYFGHIILSWDIADLERNYEVHGNPFSNKKPL